MTNLARLRVLLIAGLLAIPAGAHAQVAISGLPAATTPLAGTETVPIVQGGVTKRTTVSDMGGVGCTLANPTATSATAAVNGSASTCMRSDAAPALGTTTGTGGLVRATSPALVTPTGIVKGDVGLGNVDNTSDSTKNAASVTLTNKTISGASNTLSNVATGSLATVQGNGSKVQLSTGSTTTGHAATYDANGNVVDSGAAPNAGTVTSVACGSGLSGGTITATGTCAASVIVGNSGAAITGTTYTINCTTDAAAEVLFTGNSALAVTLNAPTGACGYHFGFTFVNQGSATATITASGNINGASTKAITAGKSSFIFADPTSTTWYSEDGL